MHSVRNRWALLNSSPNRENNRKRFKSLRATPALLMRACTRALAANDRRRARPPSGGPPARPQAAKQQAAAAPAAFPSSARQSA